MSKLGESNVSFSVYEDAVEYCGVAKVGLPDIPFLTNTISGAGIAGNYEVVLQGLVDAMTATINWRVSTKSAMKLSSPGKHHVDLRVAQQQEDTTTGNIEISAVKHILIMTSKKIGGGSIAPASASDPATEYSVSYFATYIDGKKVAEIDPLNFICEVNGTDYLADVRRALGK